MMKIAIVGAGAVGCYYGGRLALNAEANGHEVFFLLRSDYETVRAKGLRVQSVDGDFHLPKVAAYQSAEEIGEVDLILVAWKATANKNYEKVLSPMLGDETVILTLQNGLGNMESLAKLFGKSRVLSGLCYVRINRLEPGLISHTGGGKIIFGEIDGGKSERLLMLEREMKNSEIMAEATENLLEEQWRKLVWNIPFNGLCITEGGIDTEELLQREGSEEKVSAVMEEVIEAARAMGCEIEREFIDQQIEATKLMGKYRPSSMIDYVEGREIEIEAIWGEPVRRAEAMGVETPQITSLRDQIQEMSTRKRTNS